MQVFEATPATSEGFILGEGPVWDAPRARLLWVDIVAGQVLIGTLDAGPGGKAGPGGAAMIEVTDRLAFDVMVGAVSVADDGRLLVAAQEQFVTVGTDGSRAAGPRVVPVGASSRMNDGKPDPRGRYWVGTLSLDGDSTSELLCQVADDGALVVVDRDLGLSNGLGWSVDGSLMYSVDTNAHTIWVRDYGTGTGAVGPRRVFAQVTDAYPDGLCVDAEDHVWVALWGGNEVRRLAPDGQVVARVAVPAPHVSSVAFAGPDLDVLVITTARDGLEPDQLEKYPLSGHLFTARVGVQGTPVAPWNGV